MDITTLKEFDAYMTGAYKNSNYFDCQYQINSLKKYYSNKEIIKHIKKEINKRKKNELVMKKEIKSITAKYSPFKYYSWDEALQYITHDYKHGEYIFYYGCGICIGKIVELNKNGYKVFKGRKIGIHDTVSFSQVICHASNIKKLQDEINKKQVNQ